MPPAKLHDIFGADAALYITISEYGTQYMLDSATPGGDRPAKLVDLRTGTTLWTRLGARPVRKATITTAAAWWAC